MSPCVAVVTRCVFRAQTGMVLLLCLIFLMALTMLGLSATSDTILQNRLTSNLQEAERAKQSALLGLAWAEHWLLELAGPPPEVCSEPCSGLYLHAAGELPSHPEFEDFSWWIDQGHEAGIDPLTGVRIATLSRHNIKPPVWIIEVAQTTLPAENGTLDLQVWYRILVRGSGRTDTGVSVIESTLVRSWPVAANTELTDTSAAGPCPGSELLAVCGRFSWRELR